MKKVVIETVVAPFDAGKTCQRRRMRSMERRLAAAGGPRDLPVEEIVCVGPALGPVRKACGGQEQIIVHEEWPVVYFDEQIVVVVVIEVPRNPRALRHPVQPGSQRGAIDVVPADFDVDGAVEFDACPLGAREQPADMDVVDSVAGDGAERRAPGCRQRPLARSPRWRYCGPCDGRWSPCSSRLPVRAGWSSRSLRPYWPRYCPTGRRISPGRCPSNIEWLITLSSMIQPLLQWVPIRPICSAVGGAQGVAACRMVKPRTVR